jgi:hypothetical protein
MDLTQLGDTHMDMLVTNVRIIFQNMVVRDMFYFDSKFVWVQQTWRKDAD